MPDESREFLTESREEYIRRIRELFAVTDKRHPEKLRELAKKVGPYKSLPSNRKYQIERASPAWIALDRSVEVVTGEPAVLAKSLVKGRGETRGIVELIPPLHPDNRDLKRIRKAKRLEDLQVGRLSFWHSLNEEQRSVLKEYLAVAAIASHEQYVANIEYIDKWQKVPFCRGRELSWYKMEGRRLKLTESQMATINEVGRIVGAIALAIETTNKEKKD